MRAILAALLLAAGMLAHAIDTESFEDPRLQARYQKLTSELRCLQCQSESIAESNALLASDLRRQVRKMLEEGKSDAEIRKFMTDRYGDFVLYRPPLAPRTWLLWFAPALLLGVGGIVAWRVIAQRTRLVATDPDEPEEGDRA